MFTSGINGTRARFFFRESLYQPWQAVWQIPECFAYWHPVVSVVAAILLALSSLLVNVLANIISPINDLMNLAPG